jgi:hypothetical protein
MARRDVKESRGMRIAGHKATGTLQRAGNPIDFSSRSKRESQKIFSGGLSGHQDFLTGSMSGRRLVCNKGQLQVIDDPVYIGLK